MIATFTDFGTAGPYLGQLQVVLDALAPEIRVAHLQSDAPRCNPRAAAYLLAALADSMPAKTVFLAVVDPGVGGERHGLILRTERHSFVGPDNGLLAIAAARSRASRVSRILWRPRRMSASFHGRDWFAPVAAELARGAPVASAELERSDMVGADWPPDLAEIIYIDHYGNAYTGWRADRLAEQTRIEVAGQSLGYARTFSAAEPKAAFWYANSNGLAEVAVNSGSAAADLGLEIGSAVRFAELGTGP